MIMPSDISEMQVLFHGADDSLPVSEILSSRKALKVVKTLFEAWSIML